MGWEYEASPLFPPSSLSSWHMVVQQTCATARTMTQPVCHLQSQSVVGDLVAYEDEHGRRNSLLGRSYGDFLRFLSFTVDISP